VCPGRQPPDEATVRPAKEVTLLDTDGPLSLASVAWPGPDPGPPDCAGLARGGRRRPKTTGVQPSRGPQTQEMLLVSIPSRVSISDSPRPRPPRDPHVTPASLSQPAHPAQQSPPAVAPSLRGLPRELQAGSGPWPSEEPPAGDRHGWGAPPPRCEQLSSPRPVPAGEGPPCIPCESEGLLDSVFATVVCGARKASGNTSSASEFCSPRKAKREETGASHPVSRLGAAWLWSYLRLHLRGPRGRR